ncbi:DoxX family protein [Azoarcus sp. TTM-91]|uniref:DoxX family protein n=1 Tax=Azoarcus sp. TTM-91 TaxID=2691581 RepID=UPI00145DE1EB|nr:DoxX family protein [Azoarcus sp. TTM-91]NMG35339.1 DoxX family protein [Azoarcus sp. TTM-91]
MSFLVLISVAAGLSWALSRLAGRALCLRGAMRWGLALGFLFTGCDHFLNAATRYAPMIPDALAAHAMALVYFTGLAEIAGAIGLLLPATLLARLGLPGLRRQAGIWLAVMLVCVVAANINVALKGQTVSGLDFGAWYFWVRPLFQPLFIAWALYCVGAWPFAAPAEGADGRAAEGGARA